MKQQQTLDERKRKVQLVERGWLDADPLILEIRMQPCPQRKPRRREKTYLANL